MAGFSISQPRPNVLRVNFAEGFNADDESDAMFKALAEELDRLDDAVNLLVIAGESRPVYTRFGIESARDVLMHDNVKKMLIVADNPAPAVTHMSTFRTERGMHLVPIVGFDNEDEALRNLD